MAEPVSAGIFLAIGKWLLDQFSEDVADKGLEWAKREWEKVNWPQAQAKYEAAVRDSYGTVRILGKAEPTSLEDVFTDVFILEKPAALARFDIDQLRADPERLAGERISGLRLVSRGARRLFILGKPGAGKTTFLKHLALLAAQGRLRRVPIFVSLKGWSDSGQDLLDFMAREFEICAFPEAGLFIKTALERGQGLVLFDGLDEVSGGDEQRDKVIETLVEFGRQYRHSQALITCRNAAMTYQFEQFRYVEMADFDEGQMRNYVFKWFDRDEVKRDLFLEGIEKPEQRGLRELGRVPLLLGMLCLAFEDTMAFPARRSEVYDDALEALLRRWDTSRSIRRDEVYRQLSLDRKRKLLARLAAETFEAGDYFIQQEALEKKIEAFWAMLPPSDMGGRAVSGERVLKALEAQHGILIERARRIYSFAHLSFQEYFTAKYIVDNAAEGTLERLIENHLTDNRWREVFLLTASLLDKADQFLALFRGAVGELIRGDAGLVGLLREVEAVAQQVPDEVTASASGKRAVALDLALARALDLARARIFAFALALDLDRGLDPALARALARALALDRTRDLDFGIGQIMGLERYLASNRLLVACLDLAVVSDRAGIREGLLLPPRR